MASSLRADSWASRCKQLMHRRARCRSDCSWPTIDRSRAHPVHGLRPRHRQVPLRLRLIFEIAGGADVLPAAMVWFFLLEWRNRRQRCAGDASAGPRRMIASSSSSFAAQRCANVSCCSLRQRGLAVCSASSMASTRPSARRSTRCATWARSASCCFWLLAVSGIYLYTVLDTSVEGAYRSID